MGTMKVEFYTKPDCSASSMLATGVVPNHMCVNGICWSCSNNRVTFRRSKTVLPNMAPHVLQKTFEAGQCAGLQYENIYGNVNGDPNGYPMSTFMNSYTGGWVNVTCGMTSKDKFVVAADPASAFVLYTSNNDFGYNYGFPDHTLMGFKRVMGGIASGDCFSFHSNDVDTPYKGSQQTVCTSANTGYASAYTYRGLSPFYCSALPAPNIPNTATWNTSKTTWNTKQISFRKMRPRDPPPWLLHPFQHQRKVARMALWDTTWRVITFAVGVL